MIKKLQAGDSSIPASGWNEMRAFVQDFSNRQETPKNPPRNPAYIYVQNVTGSALPALSIVTIGTPIYIRSGDTFKNKGLEYGVEVKGGVPSGESDYIAITQEAIRPNCIGRAICSGATPCIIHKTENKNYLYAKPATYQTGYLEGTDDITNYRVLWSAYGTGNKEAYILMSQNRQFTTSVFVYGLTGGAHDVMADINGVTYTVQFPNAGTGLSGQNFPDIYPYDEIVVTVDLDTGFCYAIDYPTDYESDSIMAFCNGPWGRGWEAISTPQNIADAGFTLYRKDKTNAIL